jgi:hypothetical protein
LYLCLPSVAHKSGIRMELFRSPSSEFISEGGEGRTRSSSDELLSPRSNKPDPYLDADAELRRSRPPQQYIIFASPAFVGMAKKMQASAPSRFRYFPITW